MGKLVVYTLSALQAMLIVLEISGVTDAPWYITIAPGALLVIYIAVLLAAVTRWAINLDDDR